MGQLRTLLTGNANDKQDFLTEKQKSEFDEKGISLQDDLRFFQMYVNRNSKSGFIFKVLPGGTQQDFEFVSHLFMKKYSSQTDERSIRNLLADYYIAKNFYNAILGETIDSCVKYNEETLKAIKTYFLTNHGINIETFAGCFISELQLQSEVVNIIKEL